MKVLMVFLDGFGIGSEDKKNPYFWADTPLLDSILGGHLLYNNFGAVQGEKAVMVPTDASLQVPGIPQSATGQATIWTGINAARVAGGHIRAYPNKLLRHLISTSSIMKVLAESGKKVTFANAYRSEYFELVKERKIRHSASTLTALSANLSLRTLQELNEKNAVYQDFTNKLLAEWGYDVEVITPEEAGKTLARIASDHDFTLYEYFLTDRVGHEQNMSRAVKILEDLDRFIGACVAASNLEEMLLLITSDHGNIEDLSVKIHTRNPTPTLIVHNNAKGSSWGTISSLTDITPFILDVLGVENGFIRKAGEYM